MAQQYFLSVDDCLNLIFAELPQGVYATDRADDPDPNKRSYSSSELRAAAVTLASLYSNLQSINSDKFVVTVTEDGLSQWEQDYFGAAQDASKGYAYRQQNVLAKVRQTGGISLPYINSVVAGILGPQGLSFAILPWSGEYNPIAMMYGTWRLDLSELDIDTFLGIIDPILGTGLNPDQTPLGCSLDYAAAGITQEQMVEIQEAAYTYEVDIYGNASADTLALLDAQLTIAEPARSTHFIVNNAVPGPPA
jgi:hypothetical protein